MSERASGPHITPEPEVLAEILAGLTDGIIRFDQEWRFTYLNPVAERVLGRPLSYLLGKVVWAEYPELEATPFGKAYQRAMAEEAQVTVEGYYAPFQAWFEARAFPTERGMVLMFRDISERKRAEGALDLLASAGTVLTSSLDVAATLDRVTRMLVPAVADWCSVYLRDDEAGPIRQAAVAHLDAEKEALLRLMFERYGATASTASHGHPKVLRTGRTVLIPEITDAMREAIARDPEHLALLREIGTTSVIIVPLAVQGRTFGAISLARGAGRRRYAGDDLVLAEELGRRISVAVDTARLFELAQRERARAEEASRAKDEFLATLSHELRTPINAVLGWVRMLRSGALGPEKQDRALDTIDRNTRAQVQLIEDLLDFSRITAGKLQLTVAPVDLCGVVEAALDTVRPAAEARGVRIQADLDACAEAGAIQGDATRLQQIVWNLLSNAVKFSRRGDRVRVTLTREPSSVQIVVADTGQGIDPAFLPYVFDRFRQQDASSTRQHGGLGLGLAIVKHLVELHGGVVRADSDGIGKGAAFTVRLPVTPREAPVAAPSPQRALAARAERSLTCPPEIPGLRVLAVDDEPDARELIQSVLESCGAVVTTAASAAEALERLLASPPDVIVSDIGMPHEDGHALIRRIRALPPAQGGRIPAVALTAYARMEDRMQALASGFTSYAAKPIDPQELLLVLSTLTKITRG